jgi:hypothetical protein
VDAAYRLAKALGVGVDRLILGKDMEQQAEPPPEKPKGKGKGKT